ncbi:MAG: sugar-transfer associated ATP-grasp domain-containing protein [Hyphomicrobiaceae bacterium]
MSAPATAEHAATHTTAPAKPTAQVLDIAEAEKVLPLPLMLKAIASDYGKPLQSVVADIARLSFGRTGLLTDEYFTLRLFDEKNLQSPKTTFAGKNGIRKVWMTANYKENWFGPMSDKLVFDTILGGFGLPVCKTKAYFTTGYDVPALNVLRTRADLEAYLTNPDSYPFFSKPRTSSLSLGSASAVAYDKDTDSLRMLSGKSVKLKSFVDDILEHFSEGYLFQERVVPHEGVRKICGDRAATLRIYSIMGKDGPEVFRMVWKVPGGKNAADNFWRKGNILAALDYETGKITRAVTGFALDQVEVEHHPDSGFKLVGAEIPGFHKVVELAKHAHRIFGEVNLIGWDIVPTDEGGVIIEGNFAPDFKLVQMAERRGIMDERMTHFLDDCKAAEKTYKTKMKSHRKEQIRARREGFRKSAAAGSKAA